MNYLILIISCLIFLFSKNTNGQITESDTVQLIKARKKTIPKPEFDSARFSINGQYAIILEGNWLNGCYINYWTLYERGLDKAIAEQIVIIKDSAYFITYDSRDKTDSLTGIQFDGNKYTWDISEKYKLADFVKKYGLEIKAINKTEQLKITFDTLPPIKVKIPAENSPETIGDSTLALAHLIELKFYYENELLFTHQIIFLPNPQSNVEVANNFDSYIKEIKIQCSNQIDYEKGFGKLFLTSKKGFFLSLDIESIMFQGWNYLITEDGNATMWSVSADPNANFNLLK